MSDYFDRVERQNGRNVKSPPSHARRGCARGYMAWAAAMLVVLVVAGVFCWRTGTQPGAGAEPRLKG